MKKSFASYIGEADKKSARMEWADTMTYFLLAAITILFLFLGGAFWQSVAAGKFQIPSELSLGTICLTLSILLTGKIKQSQKQDRLKKYRQYLALVTAAGLLFCVCQFFGWYKIIDLMSSGSRNMVLVLLVAHFIHFLVALFLIFYFLLPATLMNSGSDLYIWFLNPKRQTIFRLSFLYWDFLSYLWLAIFVVIQIKVLL
jgi:heme/copper-type cytochrome/quinol oxidase subunit 3